LKQLSTEPHFDNTLTAGSSRFVRACLRQPVDRTPVWFLRQAGRYMPEYMAVRRHHSLLDICRTPEIAAEVTITAAERLGVDAAIIFADLLLPLTPMGLDFEFVAGEGPVVKTPLRTEEQVRALRTDRVDDLSYVARAIEKVAAHFAAPRADGDQLGIIGFCGAPFTLASYMIEGGSSRNYLEAKRMMYASGLPSSSLIPPQNCHPERSLAALSRDAVEAPEEATRGAAAGRQGAVSEGAGGFSPLNKRTQEVGFSPGGGRSAAWPMLMEKLVEILSAFAQQQVEAGADVIQIFDSWAGALSVEDYRQYCLAPTTELVRRVRAMGVPVIYFGVDTASLLPSMRETCADVIGLDWRIPLDEGWRAVGSGCAVQGNLDPIALFAPEDVLRNRVREVLRAANGRPGHIFNLGHGIVPETSVESVLRVVDWVKEYGVAKSAPKSPTEPVSEWAVRA
jgi:uroporphyrinogen-III decarboxylase